MAKKPSISDIANSLGVSKTLVSMVINNKGDHHGISKETQKKVLDKVEELNYRPNTLARGFRIGKTNTIGLIVSDISNRFYSRIARKIEDYAWHHGYSVVICSTDEKVDKEMQQIRLLQDRQVDGIIISSTQNSSKMFDKFKEEGFPHVLIDRTFTGMESPNVSVDNFGGANLAAKHLISQGIKKIGLVTISPEHISTIKERERGFFSALSESKINFKPEWYLQTSYNNIEVSLENNLLKLYQSGNMPDAFFTLNNNLTSALLLTLGKLSVKVPEDIALIGFDDVLYFNFTNPSVTAIEQPVEQIGEKAFDLLLKQIEKQEITEEENSEVLPVEIIIRKSSIKPI